MSRLESMQKFDAWACKKRNVEEDWEGYMSVGRFVVRRYRPTSRGWRLATGVFRKVFFFFFCYDTNLEEVQCCRGGQSMKREVGALFIFSEGRERG